MSKLKEIREVIIKANQDILKLAEGCVLRVLKPRLFQGDPFVYEEWTVVGYQTIYPQTDLFLANREYNSHHTKTLQCVDKVGEAIDFGHERVEIIGRPIRLADILLAIRKAHSDLVIVSHNGTFHERVGVKEYRELGKYNLLQDDLESQSPEFIDFIHSILIKK